MPLYEYQCQACGHRFEKIQKFSDAPISTCPQCGGAVEKLLSSPAIQFKGSGWYITDYARSGKGGDSGKSDKGDKTGKADAGEKKDAPAAASSTGESSTASPSESKPASSSATKAD